MFEGREVKQWIAKGLSSLERLAIANEKLIELATEEKVLIQSEPPTCPHCNAVNPTIHTNVQGDGPMANFVLVANCERCGNNIFAIPTGWNIAVSVEGAEQLRTERAGNGVA